MKKTFIGAVVICLSAVQLAKGVYIDFSGTPGAQPVSMTLTQDVNFTITQTTSLSTMMFVIDNLFATPDAGLTAISVWSAQLEFSINGGAHRQILDWVDNLGFDYNGMTAGDGYISMTGVMETFNLSAGDVVTLHAGTMTSLKPPPADFNLGADGNYNMYMVDGNGYSITGTVPEPASVLMISLGGALIAGYRRFFGRT